MKNTHFHRETPATFTVFGNAVLIVNNTIYTHAQ